MSEASLEGRGGEEAAPAAGAPPPLVPREYYSIGEACDIIGVKPHVLRYWESQFTVVSPSKNRSGNRVYQRKEIKLILLVKHLLHTEKYTIEGAKRKLAQLRRGGELPAAATQAMDTAMVALLREELEEALRALTADTGG